MSMFNLEECEKMAKENEAHPQKKARPAEQQKSTIPDLFSTLASNMNGMRQKILELKLPPESVEMEFRIGLLVLGPRRWLSSQPAGGCVALQQEHAMNLGVAFVSGVDEAAVERLKQVLSGEGYTKSFSEQRLRTGRSTGRRCVVDAQGRETVSETKNKILRLDFGCVGHQYDGRLEVATEVAFSSTASSQGGTAVSHQWTVERLKERTSYLRKSKHIEAGTWQVDLTAVTTTQLDRPLSGATRSNELEFELTAAALQMWLSCSDEREAHNFTCYLATELRDLLDTCIVQTSEEGAQNTGTSSNQIMPMARNAALSTAVKRMNSSIITAAKPSIPYSPDDFLGSMPLNISRRNLLRLEREPYFVTEKSDGVRYLMYVVPKGESSGAVTAVLVDRAGNLFRPRGAEALAAGLRAGTVLDGEIVFNLHYQRQIFLVFDLLADEGRPCAQLPFEERYRLIETFVMARVSTVRPSQDASDRPMSIIRKKFWSKKDLKELLKKMVTSQGRRVFKESDRRHHKSDGLIFQPNAPYVFGTDVDLVKWKWPELASVDLQVLANPRPGVSSEPSLMAGGPDRTLVDCCMRGRSHVGLGPFDTLRLMADVADSACVAHIAEVAFCPKVGLWSYFQLRKDKDAPNYINTVMSILMEQAEHIDIDELVARLLPAGDTHRSS